METKKITGFFRLIFTLAVMCIFYGCASSAAKVDYAEDVKPNIDITDNQSVDVNIDSTDKADLLSYEKERLHALIANKLQERGVKLFNTGDGDSEILKLIVKVTRHDKGNAFARAMLAGLGQIHIDGDVEVIDESTDTKLTSYSVKKTFAWGGIYGASTTIEDVEAGFAAGVVDGLLGPSEKDKNKEEK